MRPNFNEEVPREGVHRRVLGLEQGTSVAVAACAPNAEGKRTPRREAEPEALHRNRAPTLIALTFSALSSPLRWLTALALVTSRHLNQRTQ